MAESVERSRRRPAKPSLWGRFLLFLAIMGPGIITASGDNDATGITGYSIAGASYGYSILWSIFPAAIGLTITQVMAGRMGVATAKGLSDLIRENFSLRLTAIAMLLLLVANASTTAAECAGIAGSMEIFGVDKHLSVPIAVALVWFLVLAGSYRYVERILLVGSLFFVSYLLSGLAVQPPWPEVLRETITFSFRWEPQFTQVLVAVIGTTIAPWQMFYLQAAVVDKGTEAAHSSVETVDVVVGVVWCALVAYFIMVTTGATLFANGVDIETAADAAAALRPLAGERAAILFAVGLLNSSLMGAAILPLSTTYAICEAFGWERGVSKGFREAPAFMGLYTAILVTGAAVALWPDADLVDLMFFPNIVNGILMIPLAVVMVLLSSDKRLMGRYANGRLFNIVAWATVAFLTPVTVAYLAGLVLAG